MIRNCAFLLVMLCFTLFSQEKISQEKISQEKKYQASVLDIQDPGIKQSEAIALTERLIFLVEQTNQFTLLDRASTAQILQEQGFQQSGCTSGECAVEVGQLLGVQKMISCKIGAVGRYYTISMKIVDVTTGKIEKSVSHQIMGTIELVLLEGLKETVDLLLPPAGKSSVKAAKSEPVKEPKPELTPDQKYVQAVKMKKVKTVLFASGAGVSAVLSGVSFVQKAGKHRQYESETDQTNMNTLIASETSALIRGAVFAGITAVLVPITIGTAKKEIKKPGVTVSFAPELTSKSAGLQIRGEF